MTAIKEITFTVEPCPKPGDLSPVGMIRSAKAALRRREIPLGELDAMIADAVNGYFEPSERPQRVRLHFLEDPVVALA
ncbi:MAG: hypothetical protein L0Y58_18320 [Verrucomicrobia subdivision 3 bacterium]|nr:hypothetical protein [Limisphaerales bacterium]